VQDFLDPGSGSRPGFGAGAAAGVAGSAVGGFLQGRGGANPLPARERPPGGGGQPAGNPPARIENGQAVRDAWRGRGQEIRNDFRNDRDHQHWFGNEWWQEHPHAHWRFHQGINWWRWGTWGAVAAWVPWGWSEPAYYYYGENIYY